MWEMFVDLFGSPLWEPHGHCFLWTPTLLWMLAAANLLIGLAYYSIPLALLALVRRRRDLVHRQVFVLFALFIFGCGTTHLVGMWTLWMPVYWLQGVVDSITAVLSVLTAIVLWPLLPQVLALPSPTQLQAANQALQQQMRVQAETAAMLEQRTRALELANQELEAFTATASHDLKAPLRGIAYLATWISEDASDVLPPASKKHLATLQERIQRLGNILDDLLTYARLNREEYVTELVDTQALVEETVSLLAPPVGFTVQAEQLPTLLTERVPLATVLRNLISNALKHHNRADGHVQITAHDLGAFLEFSVADDGPGIDPQYQVRIFQLFQTLKPKDQGGGNGMGLALVKKLVESRGGQATVESALGQGAIFRFTWPKGSLPGT